MKLKSIEISNFGPFAVPTKLLVDPRVTVVTGANDTGKTSLLKAIEYSFTQEAAQAHQINQDRIDSSGKKWQDDPEILSHFNLVLTERTLTERIVVGSSLRAGDELIMSKRLNQNQHPSLRQVERAGSALPVGAPQIKHLQPVVLPTTENIRDVLTLNELNPAETRLLKLGLGENFNPSAHLALSRAQRAGRVGRAQEKLNKRLLEILPPSLRLGFRLTEVNDAGSELSLLITDPVSCYVTANCRGAGVAKALTLMGTLLALMEPKQPTLILFDEPENSLHADAQHSLRRLLESLAESPFLQVIYATHSPSMINTMRPSSIRVLERASVNGKATTIINNEAFDQNFVRVRSSLGLTPADSLLYAPVTVVVEGPTEVRSLPVIYDRLCRKPVAGFEGVDTVLSDIHFLDGTGDQYEYMVRLAKSQRAKPIIFLDGDKSGSLKKTRDQHPEVPIILLSDGQEFEDLVPKSAYIAAVAKVHPDRPGITLEAYEAWLTGKKFKTTLMFSKRVQRWLEDEFDVEPKKPLIMEHAVRDVEIESVITGPLKALLDAMRKLLEETQSV